MNNKVDVSRAWRDPEYRASLTEEQRVALPPNPAGVVELSPGELDSVNGGTWWFGCTESAICQATTQTSIECCISNHSETLLLA